MLNLKPVYAGAGLHVGDVVLAQRFERDHVYDEVPVIYGKSLEQHDVPIFDREGKKQGIKKVASGEGLQNCACGHVDLTSLPFCASSYDISPDIKDYVLVTVNTVTSKFPNRNLDAFEFEELVKWNPMVGRATYQTFIGKPVHLEHANEEPLDALGVILDVALKPFRGIWCVEILKAIDRTKNAKIAKDVERKGVVGHSMGALVEEAICSAPWCNFVSDGQSTCKHIANGAGKGQILRGHLIYEKLHNVNFVEDSVVTDPANPIAFTRYFV